MPIDERATALTRARYQRLSPIYDRMESMVEAFFQPWRKRLWANVEGDRILEVGVGTGKNMPYWPEGRGVVGVDLAPGMLDVARRRAADLRRPADLRVGDAQALDLSDASFDAAVAAFVFCSVPDPVLGLRELARVVKPGGQVLLLEHMRSKQPAIGALMDAVNPIAVRLIGANINRRTMENVRAAGLRIERVENLAFDGVFKLIAARTSA